MHQGVYIIPLSKIQHFFHKSIWFFSIFRSNGYIFFQHLAWNSIHSSASYEVARTGLMNPQVVDASPRKNNLKKHQANFHYYVYFKKTNGGCGQLNISKCVIQKFLILFQQIHHKPSKVYDFSEFSAYFLKKATFSEFSAFSEISALVDTLIYMNLASHEYHMIEYLYESSPPQA